MRQWFTPSTTRYLSSSSLSCFSFYLSRYLFSYLSSNLFSLRLFSFFVSLPFPPLRRVPLFPSNHHFLFVYFPFSTLLPFPSAPAISVSLGKFNLLVSRVRRTSLWWMWNQQPPCFYSHPCPPLPLSSPYLHPTEFSPARDQLTFAVRFFLSRVLHRFRWFHRNRLV